MLPVKQSRFFMAPMHSISSLEVRATVALAPDARVPAGIAPSAAAAVTSPPTASPVKMGAVLQRILVADDDEDDVYFIQRLIRKSGVPNPVRVFDDGSEVVNCLGGARLDAEGGRL